MQLQLLEQAKNAVISLKLVKFWLTQISCLFDLQASKYILHFDQHPGFTVGHPGLRVMAFIFSRNIASHWHIIFPQKFCPNSRNQNAVIYLVPPCFFLNGVKSFFDLGYFIKDSKKTQAVTNLPLELWNIGKIRFK